MKFFNTIFTTIAAVALSATIVGAEETKAAESLPALVEIALANNPELKSSRAKWQMFVNKAKQASALEDPMFMFKLQNLVARDPFSFGGTDPQTAKVIGISQQLPFWGKRAIKQQIADYEVESYKWSIEERKLELARMVKETWYQIWAQDKFLGIIDKNLSILSDFITIAESKYSVGQGVQQDIYKAGLEKSKMVDMQISLQQQRKSLEANLNYLLYRPTATPTGPIADFDLPQLHQSADQLNEIAYENRPQIKSLSSLVNKGQASHRLARKEFYPDFNISFEYMFREKVDTDMIKDPGDNMFTLGVTFNLPFQQERRRAMLAESASETNMSAEELNALKNTIAFNISDTLVQLERRKKLIELYKNGIIPQAEQSLESAVIGYRVSKVDFLTLLDGQMSLFNYERELYESRAEYMMRLAQLEATVGTGLATDSELRQVSQPEQEKSPAVPIVPAQSAAPQSGEHSKHH